MRNLKSPKTKEKIQIDEIVEKEKNEVQELQKEGKLEKLNLLLNFCENSYNEEDKCKKNIDTKSLYMLLICVLLIFLVLVKINIMELNRGWNELTGGLIAIRIIFLILCISEVILCFLSIIKYIRVLSTKKYLKLDVKDFTLEHFRDIPYEQVLKSIINVYKAGAKKNSSLNEQFVRKYNTATIISIISMFLLVIIYIFSFFVV